MNRTRTDLAIAAISAATIIVALPVTLPAEGQANTFTIIAGAIWVQTIPFILIGTALGAAIHVWLPAHALSSFTRLHPSLHVPAAAISGIALPACECASIHTARALRGRGLSAGAAVAFMVAAPALNPIVLTATAVAFPSQPLMVLWRALGSFITAITLGTIWALARWPLPHTGDDPHLHDSQPTRLSRWAEITVRDLTATVAVVSIGALITAALKTFALPAGSLPADGNTLTGSALMAGLAVLMSLCSEADAFIAASLGAHSATLPVLAFLITGPVIDIKIALVHARTFGWRFLTMYAPAAALSVTISLAVLSPLLIPPHG